MSDDLSIVRMFPDRCSEDVSRAGESQACDKTAVAARRDPDCGMPYPVCAYHARGDMVSLTELLATEGTT